MMLSLMAVAQICLGVANSVNHGQDAISVINNGLKYERASGVARRITNLGPELSWASSWRPVSRGRSSSQTHTSPARWNA